MRRFGMTTLAGSQLFRAGAEEAQDDAGGGPVIVLGGRIASSAKGSAVVVHVDQAHFPVRREVEVEAASRLVGNAVDGSFESTWAADGGVEVRAADERFHKGSDAATAHAEAATAIEVPGAEMVAVEDRLGSAGGGEVVGAVADDLKPGPQVPAERAHAAAEVGGSSGAGETSKGVTGIEFHEEALVSAGDGSFPALASLGAAKGFGCRLRLSSFGLRLRSGSGLCGC